MDTPHCPTESAVCPWCDAPAAQNGRRFIDSTHTVAMLCVECSAAANLLRADAAADRGE